MNVSQIKNYLGGIKSNFPGKKRITENLLIIESDDWGAIRTPSNEALKYFSQNNCELEKSIYKVDALESQMDFEMLFNMLVSIKNRENEHPVITANAIMANPDFEKIEESGFQNYYWEPFYKTYERYPEHRFNLDHWKSGIELGIFYPQFHGREHLNIRRWMNALRQRDEKVRLCFMWGSTWSGIGDYAYMEAFDWTSSGEVDEQKIIIKDGLQIFKDTFGFTSKSFIAPCYNWDKDLESCLAEQGITWIQGIGSQLAPTGVFNKYHAIPHHFAQQNTFGSYYNIRNVFFEPVINPMKDWTDSALARIYAAFLMRRPAVISTHRLNYIGYINPKNRDNGLKQLEKLLRTVVQKWPSVKFITTDQLSNYVDGKK